VSETNIFDGVDTSEMIGRYTSLVEKYVALATELAPKLEKFGKFREELQHITMELVARGVELKDPESLVALISSELEKRGINDEKINKD
jgi:hypothetical protein